MSSGAAKKLAWEDVSTALEAFGEPLPWSPDYVMLHTAYQRFRDAFPVANPPPDLGSCPAIAFCGIKVINWDNLNEAGREEVKRRVASGDAVWVGEAPPDYEPSVFLMRLKEKVVPEDRRN